MTQNILSKCKYPFLLLVIMWVVFFLNNIIFNHPFDRFELVPRDTSHLMGIFISPYLHANFNHIWNNSIMFLILSLIISFYDEEIYLFVIAFVMIVSGLMTWLFSASAVIGASGLVFGLFGAVFGIAFYTRRIFFILSAIILAFLFSQSMLLGLIPQEGISWVGHLSGLVAGYLSGHVINHMFIAKHSRKTS